jgi:hypothetical protein
MNSWETREEFFSKPIWLKIYVQALEKVIPTPD